MIHIETPDKKAQGLFPAVADTGGTWEVGQQTVSKNEASGKNLNSIFGQRGPPKVVAEAEGNCFK